MSQNSLATVKLQKLIPKINLFCIVFLYNFSILRPWIPDVILFESTTISLTFEVQGSLGIPRPAPSSKNFSELGAGLGIPSEPHSSKLRLIDLLSNRMTLGIQALWLPPTKSYVGRKFLLTRIQFGFSFIEYQNAENCKNIR